MRRAMTVIVAVCLVELLVAAIARRRDDDVASLRQLRDSIDRSRLPASARQQMHQLLERQALRPSQFGTAG